MCSNSGSTRAYQGEYEQLSSHGGAQYKPRSAAKPGSQKPAKLKTQNVQEAKKPENKKAKLPRNRKPAKPQRSEVTEAKETEEARKAADKGPEAETKMPRS